MIPPNRVTATAQRDKSVPVRALLTRGLRKNGFRKLCKDEKPDYTKSSERASQLFVGAIFLSLVLFAVNYLGWGVGLTLAVVGGTLLAFLILTLILKVGSGFIAFVYLGLSGLALAYLIGTGQGRLALITHLLPIGLFIVGRWSLRVVASAARFPLFMSLAIIVVLAPLLTEDPWRLATAAGAQLAWLFIVSTMPLLLLLIRRIIRISIDETLDRAGQRILADPQSAGSAAAELVRGRLSNGERPDTDDLTERFAASYTESSMDRAREAILLTHVRRFKVNVTLNLLTIVSGIASLTFLLVYVLAWAGMPVELAADWAKREVPTGSFSLLFFHVTLPLGPYLSVAVLFAAVGTAGFLAFALTEEQHTDALHGAVAAQRARIFLLLYVPLSLLRDGGRLQEPVLRRSEVCSAQREAEESTKSTVKTARKKQRKRR